MLFLRTTSNQGDNLVNLVDVITTVIILVHEPSVINVHPSSEIISAVQRDLVVLVNQIVVYRSYNAVKAAGGEIVSVIILAVIDGGMLDNVL